MVGSKDAEAVKVGSINDSTEDADDEGLIVNARLGLSLG